jgi:hypothetical protein
MGPHLGEADVKRTFSAVGDGILAKLKAPVDGH